MYSIKYSFNAVLGKVANVVLEIVIIELLKTKRLPILYYGVEACPVNKAQLQSLDFVLHNSFRKILWTKSTNVVKDCMLIFGCPPAGEVIRRRTDKFLAKYKAMDNLITGALLS